MPDFDSIEALLSTPEGQALLNNPDAESAKKQAQSLAARAAQVQQAQSTPAPMADLSAAVDPQRLQQQVSAATAMPSGPAASPMVAGGVPAGTNPLPPRPTIGGLPGLLMDVFSSAHRAAGTPQGQPVPTKLDKFESFLGNFIQSLAAGFSQEGHGPGAAVRGFGAAMQAPYEQSLQRYQIGQQAAAQQAQVGLTQAETDQRRAQTQQMSQMVTLPNGVTLPYGLAVKAYPAYFTGQSRVEAAQIGAQAKLTVAEMQAQIQAGKIAHVYPIKDAAGNITGMMGYNQQGQPVGMLPGAVPPAAFFPKGKFVTNSDGSYSSTTTAPNFGSVASGSSTPTQQPTTGAQTVANIRAGKGTKGTGPQGAGGVSAPPAGSPMVPMGQPPTTAQAGSLQAQGPAVPGGRVQIIDPLAPLKAQQGTNQVAAWAVGVAEGRYTLNDVPEKVRGQAIQLLTRYNVFPSSNASMESVYAIDPSTGQTYITSRKDAITSGYTNVTKVSTSQEENDRMLNNRLADVQRKMGEYQESFSEGGLSGSDTAGLNFLMAHSNEVPYAGGARVLETLNNWLTQRGIDNLSPAGLRRWIAYTQAQESMMGYMKVLTGGSRIADKQLQLNLAQLPPPTVASDVAKSFLDSFQQNIDIAGQGLPIMKGSKSQTAADIKTEYQQKQAEHQRLERQQQQAQSKGVAATAQIGGSEFSRMAKQGDLKKVEVNGPDSVKVTGKDGRTYIYPTSYAAGYLQLIVDQENQRPSPSPF